MSVLALLIPVSLVLAIVFVAACVIAIRKGQFDDMETPRWKLLFDGPAPGAPEAARRNDSKAPTAESSRETPSPESEVRS